jgi:hypothetical protein
MYLKETICVKVDWINLIQDLTHVSSFEYCNEISVSIKAGTLLAEWLLFS